MRPHEHPPTDAFVTGTVACRQVIIMLEECGLPYRLRAPQEADDALLAAWPPARVDHETGVHVAESGAILQYLAEKTGRFLPVDPDGKYAVLPWLFRSLDSDSDLDRMELALERRAFLAGEYSIADIASYPHLAGRSIDAHAHPLLARWHDTVRHRTAVRHGMDVELENIS